MIQASGEVLSIPHHLVKLLGVRVNGKDIADDRVMTTSVRIPPTRAAPVFSAATPETMTTNDMSSGNGTRVSSRIGQKRNCPSRPSSLHTIAVWSSEPPKVPTPAAPARFLKVMPFSWQARYPARSTSSVMLSCQAVVSDSPLKSARPSTIALTRADEELIPLASGRSEVNRILAGARSPKLAVRRSSTAWAYLPQCPAGNFGS